jgi:hypothetical protein
MLKYLVVLISFSALLTSPAEAYIDPGIISMFFQAVVAIFLGVFAYISLYWQKFKILVKKIFRQIDKKKK